MHTRDSSQELSPRCFSFPVELIRRLDAYAYERRLKKSVVLRQALDRYLREQEGQGAE
jgi:predicted transcriptional regulator